VQRLAGRRLYRALDLDRWRGQPVVRFADPDVALDLGGIAKGHGVDRAVEALRARGVGQAVVNVGGDLYALGAAATGAPWRVGIRSPEDPSRLAGELEISDAAVATSGDYLQYFSHGGERYHHLLDPRTAAPRRTPVRSVTVVAGTCLAADAAATAAFGLEPDRAARLLRARGQGAWIAHRITRPPHPA
jgi:thiamine biosynthesis lipoprotein